MTMRYILPMRLIALILATLLLSGCALGTQSAYESEHRAKDCPLIVVESNMFLDAVVRDQRGVRIGYAPGLTRSSFQTCTLTYETARLEIDPVGADRFTVDLPVSPMGANMILLSLARHSNHSYAEVW